MLILDSNAPAASRVRAAHGVLELAAKTLELEDIEVRLQCLEQVEKDANGSATSTGREHAA